MTVVQYRVQYGQLVSSECVQERQVEQRGETAGVDGEDGAQPRPGTHAAPAAADQGRRGRAQGTDAG